MSDKDGALQGHDLSFFRFAVNSLEELLRRASATGGADGHHANGFANGGAPHSPKQSLAAASVPSDAVAALTDVGTLAEELRALRNDVRDVKSRLSAAEAPRRGACCLGSSAAVADARV